ncbi:zinc-dependent metalloprotease [Streptomyces misionensis]|uniref:zinc-dependent metalloprotease n=1 Tax=Streptomyces misionensis TaxID=67331 RepID=UPI003409D61A
MSSTYVHNETPHRELAERIEELVTRAAPWVEKVTGLVLPLPSIELVSVEGLATAFSAFMRRSVERDTADLELTEWQKRVVAALPAVAAKAARSAWMIDESLLIATSVGRPKTLIVPEALEHLGLAAPDFLCTVVVRALAQQAQVSACDGALVPAPVWPIIPPRRDAISQFSEGHAWWTSERATPQILGRAVDHSRRRRPWTYLRTRVLVNVSTAGARRRRVRATAFVNEAVNAVGLDAFNQVWRTPGLAPTLDDFRRPKEWISRLPG